MRISTGESIIIVIVFILLYFIYVIALYLAKLPLPRFLSLDSLRRVPKKKSSIGDLAGSGGPKPRPLDEIVVPAKPNMKELQDYLDRQVANLKSEQFDQDKKVSELEQQIHQVQMQIVEIGRQLGALSGATKPKHEADRPDSESNHAAEIASKSAFGNEFDKAVDQGAQAEDLGASSRTQRAVANRRFKEALLDCQGINKERLQSEFDQYYQGPDDLEKMLRRLLEKWMTRPGLPKSVYDSINETIRDESGGLACLFVPEIRSRYDETKHEAVSIVALPAAAPGEILKVIKPGMVIAGKQITLALVERSQ